VFAGINSKIKTIKENPNVRRYTLIIDVMKHPINSFYEIKREKRSNIGTAVILLFILFIEYLLMIKYTGFIFNSQASIIRVGLVMAVFFGIITLFIFSNYLVSTLFDGEGWLKDVFIAMTYAFSPMIVFLIPFILLSNVLSLNETILYQLFAYFMMIYTLILIFIGIKEIHNYEIKETFKIILITIFTMFIIALILFIIYVFGSQLWSFIESWVKEVFFRVFK
jgi:hypothetical protein